MLGPTTNSKMVSEPPSRSVGPHAIWFPLFIHIYIHAPSPIVLGVMGGVKESHIG